MALQPVRRTAEAYRYLRGGLLPRLFTLTLAGGHSLLRCYTLSNVKPLTWTVLCVARTFLPPPKRAATERTCRCKDTNKPREKSKLACIFSEAEYLRRSQCTNKRGQKQTCLRFCRAGVSSAKPIYEKSSAETNVGLIMPRRSIFGEANALKVGRRNKRRLDYAETECLRQSQRYE